MMASSWKTVRVFISSTFRDMHAERDYLVKRVFPRLRQWCEERRLHLVDIDLRWGVTVEQVDNGAAVDICLKGIDASRPFFICILGNRYGCVPDSLPVEQTYAFHFLKVATPVSITHLEILHAALDPIPRLDGSRSEVCAQVFFYFRKPECLPTPDSLLKLTDEQRNEYRRAFFEQSPQHGDPNYGQLITGVKEELCRQYRSSRRVFEYAGTWNAEARNPEDDLLIGRLTGLGEFGTRVETDIKRAITEEFAMHLAGAQPDLLQQELALHEAFIETRTRTYVKHGDIETKLIDFVKRKDTRPLVVTGPSGSGKSAFLAHWIAENVDRPSYIAKWDQQTLVLPRFIGASPASTNLSRLQQNICEELQRHFSLTEDVELADINGETTTQKLEMRIPADPQELARKWPMFLEAAGRTGSVLIVLDAIDQFDRSASPSRLAWLPRNLPTGVQVIVSVSADHGHMSKIDFPANDAQETNWLGALRQTGLASTENGTEIQVPQLSGNDCRRIIEALPSIFCKTLEPVHKELFLRNAATRNPLFLCVALEELRLFGGFGRRGEKLDHLVNRIPFLRPSEPNDGVLPEFDRSHESSRVDTINDALDAIFGLVLDRVITETDQQVEGIVPAVFRLLASSRQGLTEAELSSLLSAEFSWVSEDIVRETFYFVLQQFRVYLVRKGTGDVSLLDFYHQSFRKAIRRRFLADRTIRRRVYSQLVKHFEATDYYIAVFTGDNATSKVPNTRKLIELPWQYIQAGLEFRPCDNEIQDRDPWRPLCDLLLDFQFLESKVEAGLLTELLNDIAVARRYLIQGDSRADLLRILDSAIRADSDFLKIHSRTVFQCLWNRCQSYNSAEDVRQVRREAHSAIKDGGSQGLNNLLKALDEPKTQPTRAEELLTLLLSKMEPSNLPTTWVQSLIPPYELSISALQTNMLVGHHHGINVVKFLQGGERVITGGAGISDSSIRIWEIKTDEEVMCLIGHTLKINDLAISPSGDLLASASCDKTLRLWDLHTGCELRTFEGHEKPVTAVAFTPDNQQIVSTSEDTTVRIWDIESGRNTAILSGHNSEVRCIAFRRNGREFVTADIEGRILLWDARRAMCIDSHEAQAGGKVLALSGDGTLAVAEVGLEVQVIDVESSQEIGRGSAFLTGEIAYCAAFSEDNRLIAFGSRPGISITEIATLLIPSFVGKQWACRCIAISPDGTKVASGTPFEHCARVWEVFDRESLRAFAIFEAGERLRQSKLVLERQIEVEQSPSKFRAFSPDGKWIVTNSDNGCLHIWDPIAAKCLSSFGAGTFANCVAVSQDGRLVASSSYDGTARVWDTALGRQVHCFGKDEADADDGSTLLHLHGGYREIRGYEPHRLAFSPDGGALAVAFGNQKVEVYDLQTGQTRHLFPSNGSQILSIEFSSDGRDLAVSTADKVVQWCLTDGRERIRRSMNEAVTCTNFSRDGSQIAIGTAAGKVHVYPCDSGERIALFEGHSRPVHQIVYFADGFRIASATDSNGEVCVWRLDQPSVFEMTEGFGNAIDFAVEGLQVRPVLRNSGLVFIELGSQKELGWYSWQSDISELSVSPIDQRLIIAADGTHSEFLRLEGSWGRARARADGNSSVDSDRYPLQTLTRLYDCLQNHWELDLTVQCPRCRGRFTPSSSVTQVVIQVAGACNLNLAFNLCNTNCWADPRLLAHCPTCTQRVRLNPFVCDWSTMTGAAYESRLNQEDNERQLLHHARLAELMSSNEITAQEMQVIQQVFTTIKGICQQLQIPRNRSRGLRQLAHLAKQIGQPALALQIQQVRAEIASVAKVWDELADAWQNQAYLLSLAGQFEDSLRLETKCERLYSQLQDDVSLAICLGNQAVTLRDLGDFGRALEAHTREEQICHKLINSAHHRGAELLTRSMNNQAAVLGRLGEIDAAIALCERVESLCRKVDQPRELITALRNRALMLSCKAGQLELSISLLQNAHLIASERGLKAEMYGLEEVLNSLEKLPPL